MGSVEDRLEVDRVKNLITGFGWSIAEEKIDSEKISLTISKPRKVVVAPSESGPT